MHPNPMHRRNKYVSLNGEWKLTTGGHTGTIRVPFPPESVLSGFEGTVTEDLVYRREFETPEMMPQETLILHIGAADQTAVVKIDGKYAGYHAGGYLPFEIEGIEQYFDGGTAGKHEITVEVTDTLSTVFPYGKQRKKRGGMWYTPVSGIWKEPWLEAVKRDSDFEERIRGIRITPGLDGIRIQRTVKSRDIHGFDIIIPELGISEHSDTQDIYIHIPNGEYWTPENPKLYDIIFKNEVDEVHSYFALRTVSIGEIDGTKRILLNGEPYFFHGVLDQGYFEEGIYTPKTPAEYEKDILAMKKLGFNTLRKHIKVEPECFYEACDRLGMIVFQDMVNNGKYSFLRDTALPTIGMKHLNDRFLHLNRKARAEFTAEMKDTMNHLYNHPCVCYYTIFNEGWGQFCSDEMYELAKSLDCTRIIDSTSGWFAGKKSDVESLHVYFKPIKIKRAKRPIVVSEFGGYSLRITGHLFSDKNYGYRDMQSKEELSQALEKLYTDEVVPFIKDGLCGAIYTQLSDVEDETNGLLTYDRQVVKVDSESMCRVADKIRSEVEKLN